MNTKEPQDMNKHKAPMARKPIIILAAIPPSILSPSSSSESSLQLSNPSPPSSSSSSCFPPPKIESVQKIDSKLHKKCLHDHQFCVIVCIYACIPSSASSITCPFSSWGFLVIFVLDFLCLALRLLLRLKVFICSVIHLQIL